MSNEGVRQVSNEGVRQVSNEGVRQVSNEGVRQVSNEGVRQGTWFASVHRGTHHGQILTSAFGA